MSQGSDQFRFAGREREEGWERGEGYKGRNGCERPTGHTWHLAVGLCTMDGCGWGFPRSDSSSVPDTQPGGTHDPGTENTSIHTTGIGTIDIQQYNLDTPQRKKQNTVTRYLHHLP